MKQNWTYKKLGEVCESDLGKTLNSKTDKGELFPYLCAVNILWDNIDLTTLKYTKFEASELERYSVRKGDLLVCEGGDIGRAAIWDKDEPIQYQNALHRIRFNGEVLPRFCLQYLHHLKNIGVLDNNYGKGVTIKHLVKSSLLSIPIPLPPLSTQSRIVSELDLLQSIIDKQKDQLKEYYTLAQSIFYDMFGDPVENEKGWEVKKLGEVCEITSSKRVYQSEWQTTGIPFYRISDFTQLIEKGNVNTELFISEGKYEELKSNGLVPNAGDILITSRGTLGNCYIVKNNDRFYFQDGMITWLKPNKELVCPLFIVFLFKSNSFRKQIDQNQSGTTVAYLSISMLKKFDFPIPPLSLQQSFAAKIESIEKQKAAISKSIAETEKLFEYTMDKYFG